MLFMPLINISNNVKSMSKSLKLCEPWLSHLNNEMIMSVSQSLYILDEMTVKILAHGIGSGHINFLSSFNKKNII